MTRLLAFLVFFLAAVQAFASVEPQVPHGDAVSLFDTIPDEWEADIRDGLWTGDLSDQLDEAVEKACSNDGVASRVSVPLGIYYLSGNNLSRSQGSGAGHGCSGLQIVGGSGGVRGSNVPQFVRIADQIGDTETRDSLIYVRDTDWFTIQNVAFNLNNTTGDGVRLEICRHCQVLDTYMTGGRGAAWSQATASTSTERITPSSFTNNFAVGTRVEFEVDDQAGASLPSPLVTGTGYYVAAKTGTAFTLSATLGGSAIDLTTAGSDFFVYENTVTFNSADINGSTNIWTKTNHGFVSGDKVEQVDNGITTPTIDGVSMLGRRFWVLRIDANQFQLALSPGGAAVNISGSGSNGQKFTAHAYAHIAGGALLYSTIKGNRILDDDMRCLTLQVTDVDDHGGAFYGTNGSDTIQNNFNCAVVHGGSSEINNNRFEGPFSYPSRAALTISDADNLETRIGPNYFESALMGPNSYIAISLRGPNGQMAWIADNKIYGGSSTHLDSKCFDIGLIPNGGSVINNSCRGVAACFDATFGGYQIASLSSATMIQGNRCPTVGAEGLPALAFVPAGTSTRPAMQIQYPVSRINAIAGGAWALPGCDANNATSLDLSECVLYQLRGAWSIASLSNAGKIGSEQLLFTDVSGDVAHAAYRTPWGQRLDLRANEAVRTVTDRSSTERIQYRMGQMIRHISQTGVSGNIVTSPVWGGNGTAGMYGVTCYSRVTTAGSAGTGDLDISWSDGVARTESIIDNQPLDSTSYRSGRTIVELSGSSDISFAWTRAAVGGSPVSAFRCAIAMLQ